MSAGGAGARNLDGDAVLAMGLVAVLAVMVVPLPEVLLDLLITGNITFSLLILITTLKTREPLEFSTFPSVLLFATLMRLALNVASSRLILLDGEAGAVISSFGKVVVGGNLFVGCVIFLILVVVQFVVITKGASRVSEVAARFTLDALPGKQMAIDADLNAGHIDGEQARERREHVSREAEFHGAMDGASKFVRGDAIASLLITGLNLLGGVGIGLAAGLGIGDALHKFAILTVGDGLVTQIPALLISTAAGVITVKSSSRNPLSQDLSFELLGNPRALATVAVMVLAFALAPGLPKLPFLLAGGVAAGLYFARRGQAQAAMLTDDVPEPAGSGQQGSKLAQVMEVLHVDRLGVELGFSLVPLADTSRGGTLIERVSLLRKQVAGDWGWLVPAVRVKENLELPGSAYRVLIGGVELARGSLEPGRYLAIGGSRTAAALDGIQTTEPSFGLPATWIQEDERAAAELNGYTVADPVTVLITHLGEVIRGHASELISRDDVQDLLDNLKETAPAVVNELCPALLSLGEIQQVLANLLDERVPIRQLQRILEALADQAPQDKATPQLVEAARQRISRAVVGPHTDDGGRLTVMTLDPRLERRLAETVTGGRAGAFLSELVEQIAAEARRTVTALGREPALVVQTGLRGQLAQLLRKALPRLSVLSYAELGGARQVETVAVVGGATS